MIVVDNVVLKIDHFPDGTILMKFDVPPTEKSHEILWRFENNEEMAALMYITRHLRSHGAVSIKLVMPYIPNARQDRVKTGEDVFTLKYFAEFINSLYFTNVVVLDPHSAVSEALIDNITVLKPDRYIDSAIRRIGNKLGHGPTLMFYPDEGAMKRYSGASAIPYAFGIKNRDWNTGEIRGLDVAGSTELINGATVLIVDDISSKGGTFYFSAKKLKELGADKIYLYVTHCENTILEGNVLTSGLIEKVFTTDSLITAEHEKIEVIPL